MANGELTRADYDLLETMDEEEREEYLEERGREAADLDFYEDHGYWPQDEDDEPEEFFDSNAALREENSWEW